MSTWADAVQKELGLKVNVDVNSILDIARVAAHAIERPAAPVTTYLLGIAMANGANLEEACRKISALAKVWSEEK